MPLSKTQEAYLGRAGGAIGRSRLEPYLQKEGRDLLRALARYHWNVDLCMAFYPVLQALEVTLRTVSTHAIERRVESLVGAMGSASQVAAKAAAEKQARKDAREAAKRARATTAAESADPAIPPLPSENPELQ